MSGYTEKQLLIISHLKRAISRGQVYFKSKQIASEIGLSSREIGSNMVILSNMSAELDIKQWGYSGASTTWKVTQKSDIDRIIDGTPEPAPLDS